MSYNFTNILEFRDFVVESFTKGNYTSDIENFRKGRNTTPNEGGKWHWVESGKMYLVNNAYGSLYIIYRHPSPTFSNYLWYYHLGPEYSVSVVRGGVDKWEMGTGRWSRDEDGVIIEDNDGVAIREDPLGGVSWVNEYLVLDSHSLTFMNWINVNPFEAKQ